MCVVKEQRLRMPHCLFPNKLLDDILSRAMNYGIEQKGFQVVVSPRRKEMFYVKKGILVDRYFK